MDIVSTERISPTNVLHYLSDQEDLKPRQQQALEYLQKHVAVQDEETLDELKEELKELDTFKDDQILKIIEILPGTEQEVRTLFSKERIKLEDSDVDQVLQFSSSVARN